MPRREHKLKDSKAVEHALHQFANRVFYFRKEYGLSRKHLAEMVGCSESNIKNIEAEESSPSFAVFIALGKLMDKAEGNELTR